MANEPLGRQQPPVNISVLIDLCLSPVELDRLVTPADETRKPGASRVLLGVKFHRRITWRRRL